MIIKSVVNSITMKLMSLFHHIMFPIKLIEDILKELSNHKEPCPGCNGYIEFGLYLKVFLSIVPRTGFTQQQTNVIELSSNFLKLLSNCKNADKGCHLFDFFVITENLKQCLPLYWIMDNNRISRLLQPDIAGPLIPKRCKNASVN